MKKILHSIQGKSENTKTWFVVFFAIIATGIIIALWLVIMHSIKNNDDTVKTEKPLKTFTQVFSQIISKTKEDYTEGKNTVTGKNTSIDIDQEKNQNQTMSADINTDYTGILLEENTPDMTVHIENENNMTE